MTTEISISRKSWYMLFANCLLVFLINIDYSAVNLALVAISEHMDSDLNTMQWLLSVYMLAWGSLSIVAGKMSDIFGKRKFLMLGILTFTVASLVCGFSENVWQIILGRILQGIGGALFVPPLYAILFQAFPVNKQGFAIGTLGVAAGIGLAIGPTFAGFLVEYLGWRWVFLSMVPISLITVAVYAFVTDKSMDSTLEQKADYKSAVYLSLCIMLFMYTMNQIEIWGAASKEFIGLMVISGVLFIMFKRSLKQAEDPLIPSGLFRNKHFLSSTLAFCSMQMVFSGMLVLSGLYLQNVMNYDPYTTGLIFISFTIGIGALSPIGGKLTDMIDPRIPIAGGIVITMLASLLMAGWSEHSSLIYIIVTMFLGGIGLGMVFPATNTVMMQAVKADELGTASGAFVMFATIGNCLSVILTTSALVGIGQHIIPNILAFEKVALNNEQLRVVSVMLNSAFRNHDLLKQTVADHYELVNKAMNIATTHAIEWIMIAQAIIFLGLIFYTWKSLSDFKR